MPNIGYESAGFQPALAGLNGGGVLTCTWPQLVWAAVTVGKAFGDEAAFGVFSTFERIHRSSLLYAYLVEAPSGAIMKADTYLGADPSEKGNISYSLGMTVAKLYSELLLSTPRLLHYATYAGGYAITTGAGGSRPDLIGLTSTGDWVVLEAKGRSNALEAGVVATAKLQSLQILTIDGLPPVCRVGMAAYFAPSGLRFSVEDPVGGGSRKVDITQDKFAMRYDSALRRLIQTRTPNASRRIAGHQYLGAEYPEADLFLSIPEDQMLDRGRMLDDTTYLGRDGLLIELGSSWREGKMLLQPQLR
ncbi:hypothetical protein SAMN05421770_103369 [Granulicella rosea]|uniref:Uncharacterized protein n=1 Tax=Granulicella rosea TaxID=474952 RepID=A0A239IZU1_9BACT|nr:hypothetical protein [Granulicella rosea]SNS99069.1 hypothetical protein SAMN05421770_103369 [Granulicella rosea]